MKKVSARATTKGVHLCPVERNDRLAVCSTGKMYSLKSSILSASSSAIY